MINSAADSAAAAHKQVMKKSRVEGVAVAVINAVAARMV